MAIPEGYASVARGSSVARGLLDAAKELKLDPKTAVRTTSTSGYLVPTEVADLYNENLAKATAEAAEAEAKAQAEAEEAEKSKAAEEKKAKAAEAEAEKKAAAAKPAAKTTKTADKAASTKAAGDKE